MQTCCRYAEALRQGVDTPIQWYQKSPRAGFRLDGPDACHSRAKWDSPLSVSLQRNERTSGTIARTRLGARSSSTPDGPGVRNRDPEDGSPCAVPCQPVTSTAVPVTRGLLGPRMTFQQALEAVDTRQGPPLRVASPPLSLRAPVLFRRARARFLRARSASAVSTSSRRAMVRCWP